MRTTKKIKGLITDGTMMIFAVMLTVIACNQRPEDTKDAAEDHNEAKFDDKSTEKDAQFLVEAAAINLNEIQLGQLAGTNATMQEVKDLGKMMEDEHSKKLEELKTLAAKKTVTIPVSATEQGQDDYKKLSEKTGKDFDKDFCDMMVKGHKDAIDKFEKASSECNDAEIKEWATATLPALRNHLDHALTCQEKMKKSN
jgi:putative membrane protein